MRHFDGYFSKNHIEKRLMSLFLCYILLWGTAVSAFAAAAGKKNDSPVIFIAGFASTPTVYLNSGDRVFPPDPAQLKPLLREYAWLMFKSLLEKDYTAFGEPLVDAVYRAFDPIRCDENGDPLIPATTTLWTRPTGEELRAKCDPLRGYTAEDQIYYSFDWRLDLKTLAADLHDFIVYVLSETGAEKVRLIGSSMGACVLATYMDVYGCEYLEIAVFLLLRQLNNLKNEQRLSYCRSNISPCFLP